MRRPALYSSSRSSRVSEPQVSTGSGPLASPAASTAKPPRLSASSPRVLWSAILLLAILLAVSLTLSLRSGQRKLTQEDINAAVLKTMETQVMPS
ncbi:MAG: peptidase S1, partial [Ramlibacter sp.]